MPKICGGKVVQRGAWIRGYPTYSCEKCEKVYYTAEVAMEKDEIVPSDRKCTAKT